MRAPASLAIAALLLCLSAACASGNISAPAAHGRGRHARQPRRAAGPQAIDLGVLPLQLFVYAPVGGKQRLMLMRLWLKQLGPGGGHAEHEDAVPHLLPHQRAPAIHGFAWLEDFENPEDALFGHHKMTVDPELWQPGLVLETASGAQIWSEPAAPRINASLHYYLVARWRPFDFVFLLGNETGPCYKVHEASKPGFRVPFCLPPLRSPAPPAQLCRRLAPPQRYTPATPALWIALPPFRTVKIKAQRWAAEMKNVAARLHNFEVHYAALGSAGVLLYADGFMVRGLLREPLVRSLIRRRRLIFVHWDLPERSPLLYNYDQALVASHAFLGLSACGTNLQLLYQDIDEMVVSITGLRTWQDMQHCMFATAPRTAALFTIFRIDAIASRVDPTAEAALWRTPAASLAAHPLLSYDMVAREPHKSYDGKSVALPAADIAAAFVHDAWPLVGTAHMANPRCAIMVHIINAWGPRIRFNGTNFARHVLTLPYSARTSGGGAAR